MILHEKLTDKIIGAYYKVYNTLGYGFLEKVYENSLAIELKKMGLKVEQQKNIKVFYERPKSLAQRFKRTKLQFTKQHV